MERQCGNAALGLHCLSEKCTQHDSLQQTAERSLTQMCRYRGCTVSVHTVGLQRKGHPEGTELQDSQDPPMLKFANNLAFPFPTKYLWTPLSIKHYKDSAVIP